MALLLLAIIIFSFQSRTLWGISANKHIGKSKRWEQIPETKHHSRNGLRIPKSHLTFEKPSIESARRMYDGLNEREEAPQFNNGMTNPQSQLPIHGQVNDINEENNVDSSWWPRPRSIITKKNDSTKWRVLQYRRRVGKGWNCYKKVRNAALSWEFHRNVVTKGINNDTKLLGIICAPPDIPSLLKDELKPKKKTGKKMITYTETKIGFLRFYAQNPVVCIYNIIDQQGPDGTIYSSTAYGTLRGHWLCGEERVTVAFRGKKKKTQEFVEIEIISHSKPAPSIIGLLVWPFIGRMQNDFFNAKMDHFEQVAK